MTNYSSIRYASSGTTLSPAAVTTSDTAPTNPDNGDMWFDSSVGKTFIWYDDGTSAQWVQMSPNTQTGPAGADGADGSSGASIDVLADLAALIAKTGMSNGDQAFVTGNNNLYIYSGTGWYKVATVQNDAPSAITGVNGTYELAIDGTATTITAVSTDPEGFPLTWSYSTSGLGSIATVSHSDGVFTITPSTTEADAGTFSLTINATDGVNGAVSTSTNLTLEFIVIVTNSKYTTLLATAVDTSDNNNITDASSNNHSITVNGDAHAGTFSPYRSGGYSTYFDGSGDFLTTTMPVLGTGSFTVEFWFYPTDPTRAYLLLDKDFRDGNFSLQTDYLNTGLFYLSVAGSAYTFSFTPPIVNQWNHIAISRNSSSLRFFLNGVQLGTTSTNSGSVTTGTLYIGGASAATAGYLTTMGYISDVRIIEGSALYTGNFTPPTETLTAITNTTLLTCHLPYIADGSTNAHAITVTGNVSTKPLTPFDNLEYSEALHGSSGYFGGNVAYLSIANDASYKPIANEDYTIESWVYLTATPSAQGAQIIGIGEYGTNSDWVVAVTSSLGVNHYINPNALNLSSAAGGVKLNSWNHIAVSRSGTSTNNTKIFINGELVAQGTNNSTLVSTGSNLTLGGDANGDESVLTGYISDARIVKGTAVYTAAFTPPTAPLTAVTNTTFLLNPNPSIVDKAQTSNLQLVGNTTGSTTQVKFAGSKSMYFDGTGDYLAVSSSSTDYDLPADFTIEAWIYPTALSSDRIIVDTYNSSQAGSYQLYWRSGGNSLVFYSEGDGWLLTDPSSSSISVNTWNHVAVSRSGTSAKMFVNGTVVDTATNSRELRAGFPVAIGYQQVSGSLYFAGYIQDVRISNGLARYTANFTPPTSSLEG